MPVSATPAIGIALGQVLDGDVDADLAEIGPHVEAIEAAGFDAAWALDQVSGRMPTLEPLTLLSYAAALTERIDLGVAVLIPAARSPVNLAKTVATVDRLSAGRLIVGLGLGDPDSMPAFGFSGLRSGEVLDDEVTVLEALWQGEPVRSTVGPFAIDGEVVVPGPARGKRPRLWFGGTSAPALARAARRGDGWVAAGRVSIDAAEHQLDALGGVLDAHGRARDGFATAKRLYVVVDVEGNAATERVTGWFDRFYGRPGLADDCVVTGGPGACVDAIGRLGAAGFDQVIVQPLGAQRRQLDILAESVLGAVPRS